MVNKLTSYPIMLAFLALMLIVLREIALGLSGTSNRISDTNSLVNNYVIINFLTNNRYFPMVSSLFLVNAYMQYNFRGDTFIVHLKIRDRLGCVSLYQVFPVEL